MSTRTSGTSTPVHSFDAIAPFASASPTKQRSTNPVKKVWTSIKQHAIEHHRSVNAATLKAMPRNPSAAKKYAREVSELQMHASRLRAYSAPNLKSYATIHKLPYDRLRRAYLKLPTRSDREASNQLLSPAQELALVRYLDSIDAIGLGIRRSQVEQQATALLAESYLGVDEAPPPLGTNWARR
ncbi:hypothetical protein BDV95DRAFT_619502 [Massariosphaeria phaeospora]|uniref:HTH CENPB-type domain-containing protein n=1 Tax=Massariosphaeria phaeospora TaxID=100035 RepID=A0A7C8I7Z3_9PLEO|nr:hypothetical protein BDV95DRAFT_619502 [Massariosphaeria phaeospora]